MRASNGGRVQPSPGSTTSMWPLKWTQGPGPAPSRGEAEKALGRKVDGVITSDWEAAAASVNLGGSISHHRPRSKIVRDIGVLVDRLPQPAEAERRRRA